VIQPIAPAGGVRCRRAPDELTHMTVKAADGNGLEHGNASSVLLLLHPIGFTPARRVAYRLEFPVLTVT